MNIIFLDVDGVIKPFGRENVELCEYPHAMDHKAWPKEFVQRLQDICDQVDDCAVVISSTWRKLSSEHKRPRWWTDQFSLMGFKIPVIGITPNSDNGYRGREVNNWLHVNNSLSWDRYVILDDDTDFYEDQPFYQLNGFTGLQDGDVSNIVSWLNEGKPLRKPPTGYHPETTRYDDNEYSLFTGYVK